MTGVTSMGNGLTIQVGSQAHPIDVPSSPTPWSGMLWMPSDSMPDLAVFIRRVDDIVEIEYEVSHASIVPGQTAKTKPACPARVHLLPSKFWIVVRDLQRELPSWWPVGRGAWRRCCLVPVDRPDMITRAREIAGGVFCPEWPKRRLSYGPTNMPLPKLGDQQAAVIMHTDEQRLQGLRVGLVNGLPVWIDDTQDGPVLVIENGWRPYGPISQYAQGGSAIYFSTGWRQNIFDLQLAVLMSQCERERMIWYYDRATGTPISVENYGTPSPDLWGGPMPETIGVPNHDPNPIPIDFAHEIRGCRRTIQLTEQMSSPMARRCIGGLAAMARLRFSEHGRLPVPGYNVVNLAALLNEAGKAPGTGILGATCGRMIGWSAFEVAQDAKVNGWTDPKRSWATAFEQLIAGAAMPSGAFQKAYGPPFPANPGFWSMQTMEYPILAYGYMGLCTQHKTMPSRAILNGLTSIYGPGTQVPILPYYGGRGPWKFLRTFTDAGPIVPLSAGDPGDEHVQGDATHAEAAIALAYHVTGDVAWLERSALYNTPLPSWQEKLAYLTGGAATAIDWQAFLVGQMQTVQP